MNMKLFDQIELSQEEIHDYELTTEEILEYKDSILELEREVSSDINAINIAKESIETLEYAITLAEESLNDTSRVITKNDVANLNLVLVRTLDAVGLPSEDVKLGTEDFEGISNYEDELRLSIEASKTAVTKIIAGIKKVFTRFRIKVKKLINTDGLSAKINLDQLAQLKDQLSGLSNKKLDQIRVIAGGATEQVMAMTEDDDAIKAINTAIKIFGTPDSPSKIIDAITSMVDNERKLEPIIGTGKVLKKLKSSAADKLKSVVCKSDNGDRIVIGVTPHVGVEILTRCKKPAYLFGYKYSVDFISIKVLEHSGVLTGDAFLKNVPSVKEILKVVDASIKSMKDVPKFHDNLHAILDKGTDSLGKIDDAIDFKNLSFLNVLPQVVYVLGNSYFAPTLATIDLAAGYIKAHRENYQV